MTCDFANVAKPYELLIIMSMAYMTTHDLTTQNVQVFGDAIMNLLFTLAPRVLLPRLLLVALRVQRARHRVEELLALRVHGSGWSDP